MSEDKDTLGMRAFDWCNAHVMPWFGVAAILLGAGIFVGCLAGIACYLLK